MKENFNSAFREFYESVGSNYPEEEVVYHSLRGRLREDFIRQWLKNLQGPLLDVGTGEGRHIRHDRCSHIHSHILRVYGNSLIYRYLHYLSHSL